MALADRFGFFDPTQPFTVTYGELPHWEQDGATYFITFRLADSFPASVSELSKRQRDDWLRRHGIDPNRADWQATLRQQSHDFQRAFHRDYATVLETALDKGHGACVLRNQKVAQIVADSLLHFDGQHSAKLLRDSAAELRSNSATMQQRSIHKHQLVAHQQHLSELLDRITREEAVALVAFGWGWFAA